MTVPRTQFYHPARVIDAAIHTIDRAIRRAEGIALVVGPPGTGKSLLLAKVAESVGDDFKVALLSGARICTRRALWQSILAELGRPYRGIDESDLRISLAELVRGLAASGSGLVILVDEAHTLPLRLLEELRLLATMPTPLPAVHIVFAGTAALEERLGVAKMESLAQRIAVRAYLEPLEHAEAVAYLRTQTKAAGLEWDACFEADCDDTVYRLADGVPRLMNQICDQALVGVGGVRRVAAADIAAAWQEVEKLPASAMLGSVPAGNPPPSAFSAAEQSAVDASFGGDDASDGAGMIEFGALDDGIIDGTSTTVAARVGGGDGTPPDTGRAERRPPAMEAPPAEPIDPWLGPDVEFVFDAGTDPFEEYFEQEERVVERYRVGFPDNFGGCTPVSSSEGAALVRHLMEYDGDGDRPPGAAEGGRRREPAQAAIPGEQDGAIAAGTSAETASTATDDSDMVVIEEDLLVEGEGRPAVSAVRLGDYRRLFARLRRGG